MQAEFWLESWRNREIGFHQSDTHPALIRHWPELAVSGSVLVPLCGKSLDMMWLAQQGLDVVGVELVESAVEEFFTDNGLGYSLIQDCGMPCYQAEAWPVRLYVGDFFQFANVWQGPRFDALYDRGALVALPPGMRSDYVAACNILLSESASGLVISLEYDQQAMQGPPFSVTARELHGYWAEQGVIRRSGQLKLASRTDVLDQLPSARRSGLSQLDECWWTF